MNKLKFLLVFAVSINCIVLQNLVAQEKDSTKTIKNIIQNTSLSGQWFMAYQFDDKDRVDAFTLKRGYFTLKTKLNSTFSVRYTQDITLDEEGGDAGNVEIRLKYLFLKAKLDKIDFLKNTYFEIGLVHRPWLDFEKHINEYRVQGKMFIEKYRVISSADFGVLYSGILGGKIDEEYQKNVNSKEPGKYGSFAVGIFNGGGYHAIEQNRNKTIEGRLTLRPFPGTIPGLQFSYGFAYGDGNVDVNIPKYAMNLFLLSSESKYHKLAGQYYKGKGSESGKLADVDGNAYDNEGYSVFGEFRIPKTKLALFSRYDEFKSYQNTTVDYYTFIGGISYRFLKNKILVDFERINKDGEEVNFYELALEIGF